MTHLNIEDPRIILIAVAVNLLLALVMLKGKLLDKSGAYLAFFFGALIHTAYGWQGLLLLYLFLLSSIAGEKLRRVRKPQSIYRKIRGRTVEESDAPRGAKHLIADLGVVVILAFAVLIEAEYHQRYQLYFAALTAALGTSLGHSLSSDLGQIYGKKVYLLITMERVKSGTKGAVTIEGSMLGALASLLMAVLAGVLGMFPSYPIKTVVLVTFAAVIANFVRSIIGGIFNQFEKSTNDFVIKFINTAIGAALCFFFVQ